MTVVPQNQNNLEHPNVIPVDEENLDDVPIIPLRRTETYVESVSIDQNGIVTVHTNSFTGLTREYVMNEPSPEPAPCEHRSFEISSLALLPSFQLGNVPVSALVVQLLGVDSH